MISVNLLSDSHACLVFYIGEGGFQKTTPEPEDRESRNEMPLRPSGRAEGVASMDAATHESVEGTTTSSPVVTRQDWEYHFLLKSD